MATDQSYNEDNVGLDVKLREKTNGTQGRKIDRASKVSSMIELFSNGNKKDVALTKPLARNFTVVNQRTLQEVIKCDEVKERNTKLGYRAFNATTASGFVRVPKPYVRDIANVKNSVQENTANTKVTANATGMASSRSEVEWKKDKPTANTLSLLASKDPASPDVRMRRSNQNGGFTMKEKGRGSPTFDVVNGGIKTLDSGPKLNKLEDKRISRARNYWEHKIEPRRDLSPKSPKSDSTVCPKKSPLSPNKLSPKLERNVTKVNDQKEEPNLVAQRVRNFGSVSPAKLKRDNWIASNPLKPTQNTSSVPKPVSIESESSGTNGLKSQLDRSRMTVKSNLQKPVVPARPRFMTSASPRPYGVPEDKKIPPKLPAGIKTRTAILEKRPVSPLVHTPPPSPRLKTNEVRTQANSSPGVNATDPKIDQSGQKSPNRLVIERHNDGNNNAIVNPIPKPERTFTFGAVDSNPSQIQPRPKHRNVVRVSSDLSIINGPGIGGNLMNFMSKDFHKSTPDVSSRNPKDGYEEVTFSKVMDDRSQTFTPTRNTKKWQRQHNYEDVDDDLTLKTAHKKLATSYDHITLNQSLEPRPLSLSDLDSGYSQLTFKQDLHRAQTSKSSQPVKKSSPPQHMKLKKQNSDMSDVVSRTASVTKSERNMETGKMLQITDKIREAFTQMSRKYRHHRRNADDGEDLKSMSSSGDEDSDTEMDLNKHRQTLDRARTLQKTYRNTLKYKSLERELSKSVETTVFEQVLICKIVKDQDGKVLSKVSYRFPAPPPGKQLGDEKTLAHFCFPDIDAIDPCEEMQSQSYSFMLTRENGTRKFGYCRRILPPGTGPRYPVVYCLISPLGSFGLYETVMDELEQRHRMSLKRVGTFLESLHNERFPSPGRSLTIDVDESDGSSHFVLRRPYDTRLEHVDLQCLLSKVGVENAIKIFSSLLLERRVIICGTSLSVLTACIHALRALLYPFVWQHVFVPVLPPPMVDLCCSPTPLLIGLLETSQEKLKTLPLEEVFILNLSTQEVSSSAGDEMEILPRKLQTPLIDSLTFYTNSGRGNTNEPNYDFALDYESAERNTVISEAFMHLFVEMIGHYQNHFQQVIQSSSSTPSRFGRIQRNFNRVSFYDDVTSSSLRRFLDLFMGTQMFDGFIHSRELANPDYEGLFERRISYHLRNADASHLNFKVIRTKMKRLMQGIGKKKI